MNKTVVFLPRSGGNIDAYISLLRIFYTRMYSDTGLWNEEYIIDEYVEKAGVLHRTIFQTLHKKLQSEILPYETLPSGLRKSVFTIENRRLEVVYTEHTDERIVEDIQIQYRK